MVVHAFNPSTVLGKQAGASLRGQPGLHNEPQDSKDYIERPLSQKTNVTKQNKQKQKPNKKTRDEQRHLENL